MKFVVKIADFLELTKFQKYMTEKKFAKLTEWFLKFCQQKKRLPNRRTIRRHFNKIQGFKS